MRDPRFRRPDPAAGRGRPVLLVPGFLAGDESLGVLAGWLRRGGFRPRGAGMRMNAGCFTAALDALEARAEAGTGRPASAWRSSARVTGVRSVGRWPVAGRISCSGVVTMGSPLVDPLAIHPVARLPGALRGRAREPRRARPVPPECLEGECCAEVRRAGTRPFPAGVGLVSIYSRSDGIVDWRACLDPPPSTWRCAPATSAWRSTRRSTRRSAPRLSVRRRRPPARRAVGRRPRLIPASGVALEQGDALDVRRLREHVDRAHAAQRVAGLDELGARSAPASSGCRRRRRCASARPR